MSATAEDTLPAAYRYLERRVAPLLEAYEDDLFDHDKKMICERPKTPFLHFTRASGTHLVHLEPSDQYPGPKEVVPFLFGTADRHQLLDAVNSQVHHAARQHEALLILHFDGNLVREIDCEDAIRICVEYVRAIELEWRGDFKVGQRVRTIPSALVTRRTSKIAQVILNTKGVQLYVLEDGGRFYDREIEHA